MISDIQVKVCGLTTRADADFAASLGVDYLGFILYPKSPRYLAPAAFARLREELPSIPRVAVMVEPSAAELAETRDAGFDRFQVYFRPEVPVSTLMGWSQTVGPDRLWLAPKLPPGRDVPPGLLPLAETFLLDTFDADKFGGTGRTSDWGKFARHQDAHPEKIWILSGGLNPENIVEALDKTGARFVDVNSGVESRPGVKDPAKVRALAAAITGRSSGRVSAPKG